MTLETLLYYYLFLIPFAFSGAYILHRLFERKEPSKGDLLTYALITPFLAGAPIVWQLLMM
jgi:hypothetical protein